MEVKINPRGNGACPLCRKVEKCSIRKALAKSLKHVKKNDELEIVVYSCPEFEETI